MNHYQKQSTSVIQRDSRGQLLPGSILNPYGRPPGALNYGGRHNRQVREFLLTKFYEKLGENWEMIYNNIMELCQEKNARALLGLLEYMVPKLREKDIELNPIIEGNSKEELKAEMREKINEMTSLIEQMKIQNKITDKEEDKKKNKIMKKKGKINE
jgi:hypothetical protein